MTTLDKPAPTATSRPVWVSAAVVAGLLVFDLVASWGLLHYARSEGWSFWDSIALDCIPGLGYAAVVAVRGLDPVRRILAAGAALGYAAAAASPGLVFRALAETEHLEPGSVRIVGWVYSLVLPTLVVLAWCLARRRGSLWPLGLLVTLVVAAAVYQGRDWAFDLLPSPITNLDAHIAVIAVLGWIPMLAGGLTAWALERLQPGQ